MQVAEPWASWWARGPWCLPGARPWGPWRCGGAMYRDFYQLKSAPFQLTPDPAWLFLSASHHAALDSLAAGIAARQGFVVLTGVKGIGKTTLVQAYLAHGAPPQLTTVVLWHGCLSFVEILTLLARHCAVPCFAEMELQKRVMASFESASSKRAAALTNPKTG